MSQTFIDELMGILLVGKQAKQCRWWSLHSVIKMRSLKTNFQGLEKCVFSLSESERPDDVEGTRIC